MAPGSFSAKAAQVVALIALLSGGAEAREDPDPPTWSIERGGKTLGGEFVHNVGALHVNVTNWGVLGSFPGLGWAISDAPSAQWPAGSGVEFLNIMGVWVGARQGGIPRVSTAYPDYEFFPGDGPSHTVFRSHEGIPGGNRRQHQFPDDDLDGAVDEDPLDGLDNDGDGKVDEDYAAVANQMLRCSYRDDYPQSQLDSPEHHPLGVEVVQETYQWEQPELSGLVGLDYTVINRGHDVLVDLYFGLYVDPDIGHRLTPRNFEDDRVSFRGEPVCVRRPPHNRLVRLWLAEAWDEDGDVDAPRPAPGRLGLMLLDHSVDPFGERAPRSPGITAWRPFSRIAPFSEGGEAVIDEQRYELLSQAVVAPVGDDPGDFRFLCSAGAFQLEPGDSVTLRFALIAAEDEEALIDLALRAHFVQRGRWVDLDPDPTAGWACRETLLYDPTRELLWRDLCASNPDPIIVPRGSKLWVNADCMEEVASSRLCESYFYWCTGVNGAETRMPWVQASAPPPPNLRIWATEGANVLFWDNTSELVPDAITGIYDFEGYRIWRADNWDRPPGSTMESGPPVHLWMLLEEVDQVNGLEPDRSLDLLRYQPNVDASLVAWYEGVLMDRPWVETARDHLPPTGFTLAEADTAIGLARKALALPGARHYYRYVDRNIHGGLSYFYSVATRDHVILTDEDGQLIGLAHGLEGSPRNGFRFAVPGSRAQPRWDYDPERVYVVPNPATPETMAPWQLHPNLADPTGQKVEFRHLPAAHCVIRIWTLAGDLVKVLHHDQTEAQAAGDLAATGTRTWNLISRNGQQVSSGIYLFTVDAEGFPRRRGKFTVIR